jgi:hypothetical protein
VRAGPSARGRPGRRGLRLRPRRAVLYLRPRSFFHHGCCSTGALVRTLVASTA